MRGVAPRDPGSDPGAPPRAAHPHTRRRRWPGPIPPPPWTPTAGASNATFAARASIRTTGIPSRAPGRSTPGGRSASRSRASPSSSCARRPATVFALEDRCAHRQVPLHAGVVDGRAASSAATTAGPTTAPAAASPFPTSTEGRAGLAAGRARLSVPRGVRPGVRVSRRPGPAPGSPPFPRCPPRATRATRRACWTARSSCHYSFMHENLMDMNHQFLHRRLMGRIRTVFLELRARRRLGRGRLHLPARRRPPAARRAVHARAARRAADARTPARDLMTIRTELSRTRRSSSGRPAATEPALDLWNVYVPLDREQRVNHTYGLMMIRKPPIPGLIHLLWPFIVWFTEGIFAEDRWHRRSRAGGVRPPGRRLEPGDLPGHPRAARAAARGGRGPGFLGAVARARAPRPRGRAGGRGRGRRGGRAGPAARQRPRRSDGAGHLAPAGHRISASRSRTAARRDARCGRPDSATAGSGGRACGTRSRSPDSGPAPRAGAPRPP